MVLAGGLPGLVSGLWDRLGVIWILLATLASTNTVHTFGYVFVGWAIGWGMATLARAVYPAPRWTLLTRQGRDQAPEGYPRA